MEELEHDASQDMPVWAIFGDLMAGVVGIFVLLLVWVAVSLVRALMS